MLPSLCREMAANPSVSCFWVREGFVGRHAGADRLRSVKWGTVPSCGQPEGSAGVLPGNHRVRRPLGWRVLPRGARAGVGGMD